MYKGDKNVIWGSLEVRHLDEGAVGISLRETSTEWYANPLHFAFTTPPAPKMLAEVDLDRWSKGRQSLITANQRDGKARYWHQLWDERQHGPLPRECPSRQHPPQQPPASSYLSRYCEWGDLAGYTPGLFEGILSNPFGGTPPKGTLEHDIFRLGNPSPILTFRLDFHRESPVNFIFLSWIDANRFLLPLGDKNARRFLACTLEPSPEGPAKTLQKR
jgi:hypothetical protein